MYTISAPEATPLLSSQLSANQSNSVSQNTTNSFDEVLNSAISKSDVISRLSSFGLPMRVKNMPRKVSCFSELAHGLTIAPNILNRMANDEAYLQEIEQQIHYWFFVHVPSREREAALLGDDFTVFAEFTIKPDGEIVKSSGIIINGKEEAVVCEVVNQSVDRDYLPSDYSATVDVSVFLSLVGNILQTQRGKD